MWGRIPICLLLAAAAPAEAQTYRQLSQWCFGQATDAETIKGCDAVIRWARESTRDAAAAFYNRGHAYRNQGELERAIEDYDQALTLRPTFADAWSDRGIAWRLKGDNERAVADSSEAIRLNPALVDAWVNRGAAFAMLGKLDLAVADFTRALALQPGDTDALRARGEVRRALGDVAGGDADIAAARRR